MHDHAHGHSRPERPLREDLDRGCGTDKLLFLDAFSGISGDMLVGALLDLGIPRSAFARILGALPLGGYHTHVRTVFRSGIAATKFDVHVDDGQPQRDYREIRELLETKGLPEGARAIALEAFRLLAEAEAEAHGMAVEDVHFHEVGAVDSIVDIVAAAAGLDWLGATVASSPLPMGKGFVDAQHGVLPLPAPATVRCLQGVPTYDAGLNEELVTPTGACLVAAVARRFEDWPRMRPERSGWGSGSRELSDRPNLLRLVLGTPTDSLGLEVRGPYVVLETNVDDLTGELAAHAASRLLEAGAVDAWITPVVMKKGRSGMTLSALADRPAARALSEVLLRETSSLGVRFATVARIERPRRMISVDTPYGPIPVKVADSDELSVNVAPEFDACVAAAERAGVSAKTVYQAAVAAAIASTAK